MDYVDVAVIFFQLQFILNVVLFHYHTLPYQKNKGKIEFHWGKNNCNIEECGHVEVWTCGPRHVNMCLCIVRRRR